MKKVSELEGAELDYWVAKAEKIPAHVEAGKFPKCIRDDAEIDPGEEPGDFIFDPSSDWDYGGPIIQKRCIGSEGESAWAWKDGVCIGYIGTSQLEAAMRVVVALEYGDEVDG